MKATVLKAMPEVFSIRGSDYTRFVVREGATEMMRKNWEGVGSRLNSAIVKVGGQAKALTAAQSDGATKKAA